MIHLYNPSTDMALAYGCACYTPPKTVALFERRNAALPELYAAAGDGILFLYDNDEDISTALSRNDVRRVHPDDLRGCRESLSPWGWNLALRHHLLHCGYPSELMPTEARLTYWRDLAHRRTAVEVCHRIGISKANMPRECFTEREALDAVAAKEKGAMLKMPWSSSGRGVLAVNGANDPKAARRIADVIRSQGCVIVETLHDRAIDFATEWESDGTGLQFKGFSLFHTDSHGHYIGNLVASQEHIIGRIKSAAPHADIKALPYLLQEPLSKVLIGNTEYPYTGPFGVDALITREGSMAGCIEINLRRTMGHVAIDLWDRTGKETFLTVK